MPETPQQYQARILSLSADTDPMAVLASTPDRLRQIVKTRMAGELSRRAAADRWSVHEIIVHLADSEVAFAYRLRMMIAMPGVRIQAFDQAAWASSMRYGALDLQAAVDRFDVLRRSNLELLRNLDEPTAAYGIHEERGREDAALFIRLYAGHDRNHLMQIDRLLGA